MHCQWSIPPRLRALLGCFLLGVSVWSCAPKTVTTVLFNPTEPLRVVVAPFVHVDDAGAIVDPDPNLLIDRVSFVSSRVGSAPSDLVADLVRQQLIDHSALDLLAPSLVTAELVHHGFAAANLSIDRRLLYQTPATAICQHHLQCDAILYGRITRWDRSYYGLQSVSTVGIALTLVSARDNQVLFQTSGTDSESRGITKGPTGIRDLFIAPIQGLDSKIVLDLAGRLVRTLLQPLVVSDRPEFRSTPPPSIFGAAHSAIDGHIVPKMPLIVVLAGSPGLSAHFSLGTRVVGIPMIERRPGSYTGVYLPLPTDGFQEQKLIATLTDTFGRMAEVQVGPRLLSLE